MQLNRSCPPALVTPVLAYPDVRAAVAWLEKAFGFAERVKIGDDHRSQMAAGDGGAVIVADAHGDRQPPRPGPACHSVMVRVEDAEAHLEQARQAGARIVRELTDFPYGERQYTAEDLAGHHWTFSQTITDTPPEQWGGETAHGGWAR